jgi:hypothetical protein
MEERRDRFRRLAIALSGLLACGGAAGCELPPGVRVEAGRIAISYRTIPANIEVGKPFVLELAACAKKGALDRGRVRLDATMPEHRHGMNYRVKVVPVAEGRFRSEGWLFHMPGRWEFAFELGGERLTHSIRIE